MPRPGPGRGWPKKFARISEARIANGPGISLCRADGIRNDSTRISSPSKRTTGIVTGHPVAGCDHAHGHRVTWSQRNPNRRSRPYRRAIRPASEIIKEAGSR